MFHTILGQETLKLTDRLSLKENRIEEDRYDLQIRLANTIFENPFTWHDDPETGERTYDLQFRNVGLICLPERYTYA